MPILYGRVKPRRHNHETDLFGACHYCARLSWLTRDHKQPRWWREERGWRSEQMPTVWACSRCNSQKDDMQYLEFHWWLSSRQGRIWLEGRHPRVPPPPCQLPDHESRGNPYYGRVRHFCAAHKPCGWLRRTMLVLDDDPSDLFRHVFMDQAA